MFVKGTNNMLYLPCYLYCISKCAIKLSAFLFAIIFFACIYGCGGNDLSKINAISAKVAAKPVESSRGVTIIYSDSARVKAILTSPHVLQYQTEKPYQELPEGLHIDFYNHEGQIANSLDAGYGIRYESEHKVMVENNVRVINSKGEKLNTEQLYWDENKKIIYTDKYVKYQKSDGIYEGDGMDADENFTNVHWHKFRGIIRMKNDSLAK